MRLKAASLVSVIAAIFGLWALPPGGARADVVTTLPISSFGQIVADTAYGYLFISQASGDSILVTDLDGNPVTTIGGQDGVADMALSPDGGTLYAALSADDAVSAISVGTLKETVRYDLGAGFAPSDLAVQRGKIWVSYNDGSGGHDGAIGEIDPAAATPFTAAALPGTWWSPPQIAADPSDSGVLVANQPDFGVDMVASYNVSTDPVTAYAQPTYLGICGSQSGDLAVLSGGAQFMLACAANPIYDTKTLSASADPFTGGLAQDFAVAPGGSVAMGDQNSVSSGQPAVPDVFVYPASGGAPQATYALDGFDKFLAGSRNLAWSANGSELFTVVETTTDQVPITTTYTLHVLYPPRASSAITLRGPTTPPSTVPIGQPFSLTGTLTPGAGAQVTVTRTVRGGATKRFTATTTARGAFKVTDTLTAFGTYTYTASFAGSGTIAPATSTPPVTVTVVKDMPLLTAKASPSTVNYRSQVTVTAHLGRTYASRTVSIFAQPAGGAKKLVKTGAVNSAGNLAVTEVLTRNTTFSVVFPGDAHDMPVTRWAVVGVRARVSASIGGYYGSLKRDGVTYRLFHRTARVLVAFAVTPNKHGQCVKLEVQDNAGAWVHNTTSGCGYLNSASKASGYLILTHASLGIPYRVRADYIHASKDTSNVNGDSGWLYFIVEK